MNHRTSNPSNLTAHGATWGAMPAALPAHVFIGRTGFVWRTWNGGARTGCPPKAAVNPWHQARASDRPWSHFIVAVVVFLLVGHAIAFAQSLGLDAPIAPSAPQSAPAPSASTAVSIARPKPAAALKAQAIWSATVARPGDQRVLAVVLDIDPRYHINPSKRQLPADSYLVPTELSAAATASFPGTGPVQYPAPTRATVRYSGTAVEQDVYQGRVILYLPVIISDGAAPGEHALKLTLAYQACDENVCLVPTSVELTATLTIDPAAPATAPPDPAIFGGYDPTAFVALAGRGSSTQPAPPPARSLDSERLDFFGWSITIRADSAAGLAGMLFLAAVGGLLLNFTPCVLPVLPLKAMSISRAATDRSRCLMLGVAMSAGVVAFWLGLGILVSAVSGFTAANQLFQYPWFTIAVGVVIAVMAVGMTGLFTIEPPRWVSNISVRQDSLAGSVGLGVMTAVLSTPCTAPFMGGAAALALRQDWRVALMTFTAIGTGMALPYLALSAFPKLVERVPRSGPGSDLLKQVMGLLMLAAAAYFIGAGVSAWRVKPPAAPDRMYWWAVAVLVVAAGGWSALRVVGGAYAGMMSRRTRVIAAACGVLLVIVGGTIGYGMTRAGPLQWIGYTPQRFTEAQQASQVVVLDFTAEWCLNCKVLEATVLETPAVVAALRQEGVIAMKVDITSAANVDGTRKLAEVGRVAIPALVIYGRDGMQKFNSDAYTAGEVLAALSQALGR